MTVEQVFKVVHAAPFEPFEVHLTDGRSFYIDHPDFIARLGDDRTLFLINADDEQAHRIDANLVVSITQNSKRRPKRRQREAKSK